LERICPTTFNEGDDMAPVEITSHEDVPEWLQRQLERVQSGQSGTPNTIGIVVAEPTEVDEAE
jgi:hypothetical protein